MLLKKHAKFLPKNETKQTTKCVKKHTKNWQNIQKAHKTTSQKTRTIIQTAENTKNTLQKAVENHNKNASKTYNKNQEKHYMFCKHSIDHANKGLTTNKNTCQKSSTKVRRVAQKTIKKT